jgi:predicted aspartyl protease
MVVGFVTSSFAQGFEKYISTPQSVALQIEGGDVSIEVEINKKKFRFGLDTGASGQAYVTPELVQLLKLPTVRQMTLSDGSGRNSRKTDVVLIDSLKLGKTSFKKVQAPVLESQERPAGPTKKTYGTIGFELFKDLLVTLNFPQHKLLFGKGALPIADGKTILNYRVEKYAPYIPFQIGDAQFEGMVDTGGSGGFLIPLSMASKLKFRAGPKVVGKISSITNTYELLQGEVEGNAQIGGITLENPVIRFSEILRHVNIGREILHQFAITFDHKNQRIAFALPRQ